MIERSKIRSIPREMPLVLQWALEFGDFLKFGFLTFEVSSSVRFNDEQLSAPHRPKGVMGCTVPVDCPPTAVKITSMTRRTVVAVALVVLLGMTLAAPAQTPAPPPGAQLVLMSSTDLDQLLGPVALYPDPLLSELLPAATLPAQIVLAERFMSQGNEPTQIDVQAWDPCIKAIAHYPELLKWMDDNLAWTTEVGQAFVNQQQDVMDAIQRLRGKAQVLGNLPDTPQETIVNADGDIDIEPALPDQVCLPIYQPDLIYDQPGVYCSFGIGWVLGPWLIYDWDWHHRHIIAWGPGHPRPGNWWHRTPQQRVGEIARGGVPLWLPGGRGYVAVSHPADRGWAVPESRGSSIGRAGHPAEGEIGRPVVRPATPPPSSRLPEPRPDFGGRPVVESHPAFEPRGSSGVGIFGGPQNSSEARQSSERGMESRGVAPSSGGGGGRRR
jgi:hypothetical protein